MGANKMDLEHETDQDRMEMKTDPYCNDPLGCCCGGSGGLLYKESTGDDS